MLNFDVFFPDELNFVPTNKTCDQKCRSINYNFGRFGYHTRYVFFIMDLFCTCRKCKKFSQNGDGRYLKTKKTFIKHQKKERSLLNNNYSSSEESSKETEETSECDSIDNSDNEQNIVEQRKKRKTR